MFVLTTICLLFLAGFAVLNVYWGHCTARLYRDSLQRSLDPEWTPAATVILCLRGNDPFLSHCLDGLMNQDYPGYRVKIVIDHIDDPAFGFVNEYLAQHAHPHCEVSVRELDPGTCGLKNASLVQAMRSVDAETEVIAWLDADVVPHRSWLREMVTPLKDPQVGIASGVRWYAPPNANPGTMIRHAWNTAAMVQMISLEIPWGGSIAMHRSVFQHPLLSENLLKMLWDDTGLKAIARSLNKEVAFVPAATMLNAESIPFGSCFKYVTRQLLNTRFYHSKWWLIATLGLGNAIAQTLMMFLCVGFLAEGNLLWGGISAGALMLCNGCVAFSIYRVSLQVHRAVCARGDYFRRQPLQTLGYLCLAIYFFSATLLTALRTRVINWRGVVYEIQPPHEIQITHYEPYQNAQQCELENISL